MKIDNGVGRRNSGFSETLLKYKNIALCIPTDAKPDPAYDTERDGAQLYEKCCLVELSHWE